MKTELASEILRENVPRYRSDGLEHHGTINELLLEVHVGGDAKEADGLPSDLIGHILRLAMGKCILSAEDLQKISGSVGVTSGLTMELHSSCQRHSRTC